MGRVGAEGNTLPPTASSVLILQTTGGAGFRLDAIKHIDRYFLLDFVRRSDVVRLGNSFEV